MSISAKQEMAGQFLEIASALKYLGDAPFKDGVVQQILVDASKPMAVALQEEYLRKDPTQLGGKVAIVIISKKAKRRLDRVYIGPDRTIGKGWQLWTILQWGTVERHRRRSVAETGRRSKKTGSSTGVMPAGRFMDIAIRRSKNQVVRNVAALYSKALAKYAKTKGLEVKGQ